MVSGSKRAVAPAFTLLLYQFRLMYLRAVVGLETDPAGASLALDAATTQTFNEVFAKPQGKDGVFGAGEALGSVSFVAQGQ